MRLFKAVSAAVREEPMLNGGNLIGNEKRKQIIEAMKAYHISSTDIFFHSEIVKDEIKQIKVLSSDVNVLFNPDEKTGDQVSTAAFAERLLVIFKGHDIKCQTYVEFMENFATACKRENKKITEDEIVSLFTKAMEIIVAHTATDVDGARSPVGKTGFKS